MAQEFTFTVNGVERTTTQNKPLLRYLRDDLHIHSAKDGCSEAPAVPAPFTWTVRPSRRAY